jgi:hypothetical protein
VVGLPCKVSDLGLEGGLNLTLIMAFSNAHWDNASGTMTVLRRTYVIRGQQAPPTGASQMVPGGRLSISALAARNPSLQRWPSHSAHRSMVLPTLKAAISH